MDGAILGTSAPCEEKAGEKLSGTQEPKFHANAAPRIPCEQMLFLSP